MRRLIHFCMAYFGNSKNRAKTSISSLAPKILKEESDIGKIRPYLDMIEKTLLDDEITNIALAGGYGAGKSTILKTFQHLYPKHKYLNISLASFKDVKKKGHKSAVDDLERHLEISILQQIFYHVKPSEIPDSRFKRIINITSFRLWLVAVGLSTWVTSAIILFRYNYIDKINPSTWVVGAPFDVLSLILFCTFFGGIGWFAKDIVRLFSNSKINKFNIKGELELGDKLDKSVFNEHLEEIIYFFERTDYTVVIIEDLDRFERTDIFTKLREINILLNQSKLIKRQINFLYAIRDEVFTDKSERVKFFEYIIPVIPFINPSNAGDQLAKLIKEADLENVLSKDFTEDVVTFIDDIDMRLLSNIFHEYLLYRQNLDQGINQDELFAIITYKNLFPEDFGALNKRTGNLHDFLSGKAHYINILRESINEKLEELTESITKTENEELLSLDELKTIYINKIRELNPNSIHIEINGRTELFSELLKDENFNTLRKAKHFVFQNYKDGHYYLQQVTSQHNFATIERSLANHLSYEERKTVIQNKSQSKQKSIRTAIQSLKAQSQEIETWNLKRIFEDLDITPYLKTFESNMLVRNLLINGYINENYTDYISLFHEVNIAKEDFTFLRSVKSGINSAFGYELNRINNLIKKIPQKYFSRDAVLNYSLMDFLGKNYEEQKELYLLIVKNISSGKKQGVEFAYTYIDRNPEGSSLFVKLLSRHWDGLWENIINRKFTQEITNSYLKLLLRFAENSDIITFNEVADIGSYIESQNNFLELAYDIDPRGKIESLLTDLAIKFDTILPPTEILIDLFDFVYQNNHYKINKSNISLFAIQNGNGVDKKHLDSANYTTILNSGCDHLLQYIEENIETYVNNIILDNPKNIQESETSSISLLNNENINLETRFRFIEELSPIILNIKDIDNESIIRKLIAADKIGVTWENVYSYFEMLDKEKIDDLLVNFLNAEENYKELASREITTAINKEKSDIEDLIIAITKCDDLELESYQALVKSIKYTWNRIGFEKMSGEKVKFLIEEKILASSADNYEKLKEHFSNEDYHILYLQYHYDYLLKEFDTLYLDNDEIRTLLQSKVLEDINKLKFLRKISEKVIIDDSVVGRLACEIFSSNPPSDLSYELIQSLFKNGVLNERKILILNANLNHLSAAEVKELITQLGGAYPDIFEKQHKPKFSNSEYHQKLFNWLKIKGLIKNYGVHPKENTLIRVTANYQ